MIRECRMVEVIHNGRRETVPAVSPCGQAILELVSKMDELTDSLQDVSRADIHIIQAIVSKQAMTIITG